MRLPFILKNASGEFHFTREIDPPITIQIIVASSITNSFNDLEGKSYLIFCLF